MCAHTSFLKPKVHSIKTNQDMSYGSKAQGRLKDKTILVTGASAGIGEATVRELADAANGELKFILTARRKDKLDQLESDLKGRYPSIDILAVQLDVSKIDQLKAFVRELPERFSDIDVLINNAGKALGREQVGEIDEHDITEMFNTNVLALMALTQEVLPIFKAKNSGDIVNLGSIAGRDPYPGGAIYCPTKAAVKSFSQALRKELIATKIRVIEVDPGNVETEFSNVRFRGDLEKAKAVYSGTEPLLAADIAEVITFALTRKQNTVVAETLVFSTNQASASHLYREAGH